MWSPQSRPLVAGVPAVARAGGRMTMLKAIETRYKGYRFRSRLEARWAVFFETMECRWEYEPEGFDLSPLGWYLPDFRIDGRLLIEIKPLSLSDEESARAVRLCSALALKGNADVALIRGVPDDHVTTVWAYQAAGLVGSGEFGECVACGRLCLAWLPVSKRKPDQRLPRGGSPDNIVFSYCRPGCIGESYHLWNDARGVMAAYAAARSARFEHGETP
jgi:hypothetical protein